MAGMASLMVRQVVITTMAPGFRALVRGLRASCGGPDTRTYAQREGETAENEKEGRGGTQSFAQLCYQGGKN